MSNLQPTKRTLVSAQYNWVDRLVSVFNPIKGAKRAVARTGINAISSLNSTGFITPGKNKRSMRGWFTSNGSADKDTLGDLKNSRSASRDLVMNTPVAVAALNRKKSNVIGYGLQLQCRIDRRALGLTEEAAAEWERNTEREWKVWAGSKNCDVTRTQNFNQLQQLAFYSKILSGDAIAILPFKKTKNFPYKLRVKLIEGDRLSNPNNYEDISSTKLRGGIEVNNDGAPIAYHIQATHPGDYQINTKWIRVPAFGSRSGRRNVLHVFNKDRPGQRRGMPELAPVMEQLKQLSRLSEAELMGALVSAFYTVFVETEAGDAGMMDGFPEGDTVNAGAADEDQTYDLASGNIVDLKAGEKVSFADPKRPNAAYEPFHNALVKQIAAAINMPYSVVMLHFTASYSAARGELLEAYKAFVIERLNFAADFNQPIYEEFLNEAVLNGRISAPGYLNNSTLRMSWSSTKWVGPGPGQLDPKKETTAAVERINNRLSTYEDESQLLGNGDWEGNMDRLESETKTLTAKGLDPVSASGSNPDNSEDDDDDGKEEK